MARSRQDRLKTERNLVEGERGREGGGREGGGREGGMKGEKERNSEGWRKEERRDRRDGEGGIKEGLRYPDGGRRKDRSRGCF